MATILDKTPDGLTPVLNGEPEATTDQRDHASALLFSDHAADRIAALLRTYTDANMVYRDLCLAKGDRRIADHRFQGSRSFLAQREWEQDDVLIGQLIESLAIELSDKNSPF